MYIEILLITQSCLLFFVIIFLLPIDADSGHDRVDGVAFAPHERGERGGAEGGANSVGQLFEDTRGGGERRGIEGGARNVIGLGDQALEAAEASGAVDLVALGERRERTGGDKRHFEGRNLVTMFSMRCCS